MFFDVGQILRFIPLEVELTPPNHNRLSPKHKPGLRRCADPLRLTKPSPARHPHEQHDDPDHRRQPNTVPPR